VSTPYLEQPDGKSDGPKLLRIEARITKKVICAYLRLALSSLNTAGNEHDTTHGWRTGAHSAFADWHNS
jgi:hypothetical protein